MVIFHSYVSLPEGKMDDLGVCGEGTVFDFVESSVRQIPISIPTRRPIFSFSPALHMHDRMGGFG